MLATSLPLLLPHGIHELEAWNEAVCGGAWGQRLARAGERLRRAVDLEHWAAFARSFGKFERLLADLATGTHDRPPASITVVSGDIHHSYLATVDFPPGTNPRSAAYQAVCEQNPDRHLPRWPWPPLIRERAAWIMQNNLPVPDRTRDIRVAVRVFTVVLAALAIYGAYIRYVVAKGHG